MSAFLNIALPMITLFVCLASAAPRETILHSFQGFDGKVPFSRLVFDAAGNLYGTAQRGGDFGMGVAFELSPDVSFGWKETVLYSFTGEADGASPGPYLSIDRAGNLYGTAGGGANSKGVVFELSPNGSTWTETVLYNFCSQPNCTDGAYPDLGLVKDKAGNLYGVTTTGTYPGTIFQLSHNKSGWKHTVIYVSDVAGIIGMSLDKEGNLYGVSPALGLYDGGFVLELSPNGSGGWNPNVIYNFSYGREGKGAAYPSAKLILDAGGNLYGTTFYGGTL